MRVLICGGSHADIPQIQALRKLGHWVATSGNNPLDHGHRHSDAFYPADYSDPNAINSVILENRVDAIIPCCNDFSYLTCADLAPTLMQPGFDAPEIARLIHDKDRFRALCANLGILVPRVIARWPHQHRLPKYFDTEVIVKPVDLSGGKGITRIAAGVDPMPAILNAAKRSKAGRVVVEEFIKGSNHGLSTLIIKGKVCFSFVDEEHYFLNPYLVSGASTPAQVRPEVFQAVVTDIETLARNLNLADGIVHSQFIQTDSDHRLIEICRRPPGDLYTRFVEIATGVPYPTILVKFFLGEVINHGDLTIVSPLKSITRHCAMPSKEGRFIGLSLHESIENRVIESMSLMEYGENVSNASIQKAAILFIDNSNTDKIIGASLPDYVKVVVE
jgi:biotin carboxylase